MLINLEKISSGQAYHLLTQTIIPRPIAWVLSENQDASLNLAPFSFFTAISSEPPLIMFSVGLKPDGAEKDTRLNIVQRERFVVNIPSIEQAEAVSASSATFEFGVSEVEQLNIETFTPEGWALPKIASSPIALACELYKTDRITEKQMLVFGLVKSVFVDDQIVGVDDKQRLSVNAEKVNPLLRLGANQYANLGQVLEKKRPI